MDEQTIQQNNASNASSVAGEAPKAPPDELRECQEKREEYLNGWKRAQADFANYKKEEGRRFEDFSKFASSSIVRDLLSVLDSFDLALASLDERNPAYKGVAIIKSQLESALKRHGLGSFAVTAEKDVFDPSLHEAVMQGESDLPPDTILEVIEEGYTLHGKVIRPAKVKVSK